LPQWLDALTPEGRLLVPITIPVPGGVHGAGLMLRVQSGEARFTSPVQIFHCAGARDPALEPALKVALFGGRWKEVRRIRRDPHQPGPACVVHGAASCLASE
jgi:protein-L-isoaspartate(D-aspartate) O-methyltransferase